MFKRSNLKKRMDEMKGIFEEINYKIKTKNYSPVKRKSISTSGGSIDTSFNNENILNKNEEILAYRIEDNIKEEFIRNMAAMKEYEKLKKECDNLALLNVENIKEIKSLTEKLKKYEENKDQGLGEEFKRIKLDLVDVNSDVRSISDMTIPLKNTLMDYRNKVAFLEGEIDFLKNQMILNYQEEKIIREELLNLKGNIRVILRLRNKRTSEKTSLSIRGTKEITVGNKEGRIENFKFDHILDMSTTQIDVFREFKPMVLSVLDGYNICLFAYGQTGSGKTYTMEGDSEYYSENSKNLTDNISESDRLGLIPRSMDSLFKELEIYNEKKVDVNYVEIYNEEIVDLIGNSHVTLKYEGDNPILSNCITKQLNSLHELNEILQEGKKKRSTGKTNCNARSSRSHSILTVKITISGEERKSGTITFIDLAGSERLKESKAEGKRLKETQHINKSLSALRNVITALTNKEKHIPYRDSKLTYLLKNYLSSKSRVGMIVNISPEKEHLSETLCTLRFGSIAQKCNLGTAEQNKEKYI